jgi:acyl-CoA dehydrogenase/glutaryl-CoA dehydrogenase
MRKPGMLDYIDMESTLSEEEQLLADSARSFIDGEVDNIGQHWIDGTFPTNLIPKMGEMGFYAPNLKGADFRESARRRTAC